MTSKLESIIQSIATGNKPISIDLSNEGLSEFPVELFALCDCLEVLNMGGNRLQNLPLRFVEFKKLRVLFFAQNFFDSIPAILGEMTSLRMVSFKSNQVSVVPPNSLSPSITWLILTDNRIEDIPSTIGTLTGLRKCMLAGNRLRSLPDEMQNCKELELLRIAANSLTHLPSWLFSLPKLSWLAYAGNPIGTEGRSHENIVSRVNPVDWNSLVLGECVGQGASGYVYKAEWNHDDQVDEVAVKLFKGGTTSDGSPEDEMLATETVGEHPNFIRVLGRVHGAPDGQQGLVLPLLDSSPTSYQILGNPPSFDTCTRDTFAEGVQFSYERIFRVLLSIASACAHLHASSTQHRTMPAIAGIMHGDLYAHNILVHQSTGQVLLTDFGAASFKPSNTATTTATSTSSINHNHILNDNNAITTSSINEENLRLEQIEVRAFGCLIEDLWLRADASTLPVEGTRSDVKESPLSSHDLAELKSVFTPLSTPNNNDNNLSTAVGVRASAAGRGCLSTETSVGSIDGNNSRTMEILHLGVHSNLSILLQRLCAACCTPIVRERPTFDVIYQTLLHYQSVNQHCCEWLKTTSSTSSSNC